MLSLILGFDMGNSMTRLVRAPMNVIRIGGALHGWTN